MFPDKNLFIVSSSLKPKIGVFENSTRIQQTLETFRSIRKQVPNSIILFADSSSQPINQEELKIFDGYIDLFLNIGPTEFGDRGLKSQAETLLLLNTLYQFKQNLELMKLLHSIKRIFKLSGRYKLQETFDIKDYDNKFGNYIFRKRIPSWLPEQTQKSLGTTDLLVTRLFSFCPSLLDDYIITLQKNFELLNIGIDTEHAHFVNINKDYLVEFDKVHCQGYVASTGELHID